MLKFWSNDSGDSKKKSAQSFGDSVKQEIWISQMVTDWEEKKNNGYIVWIHLLMTEMNDNWKPFHNHFLDFPQIKFSHHRLNTLDLPLKIGKYWGLHQLQ